MDFVSKLLQGIAFLPARCDGIEGLFGGRWRRSLFKCFDVVEACSALKSSDFFTPILERFLDLGHELVGDGSVDEPVIVA